MKNLDDLVPAHEGGVQTNTESSATFDSAKAAEDFYTVAKQRLMDVNRWHELAGAASAEFQLTDDEGKEVERKPIPGDHFRIGLLAPGPVAGEGYDWVRVEAVDEEIRCTSILVRPAPNPLNKEEGIAHFFADGATSSFVVRLDDNKVFAGVHGRNEKPNMEAENFADKIRNAVVGAGAMTGLAKLQWKSLVNGIVDREGPETDRKD